MKRLVGALSVLLVVCSMPGCTRINPGNVGIKINMAGTARGVSDLPLETGWVFYMPGVTKVFEYPTFMQTAVWTASVHEGNPVDESITFTDKDQVPISADINLSYRLESTKVPNFYIQFRSDDIKGFTHGYLRNVARDAFNAVASQYSFDEINGMKKEEILLNIRKKINDGVGRYGVIVEQFGFIGALRPPANIAESINLKIAAIQKAIQSENELRQAKADAAKTIARAEGEAKANQLLASSISQQLIDWRRLEITMEAVKHWDGKRPMVEGNNSGLLLQIDPSKSK